LKVAATTSVVRGREMVLELEGVWLTK